MKDLKALFDELKGSGELQAKFLDALKENRLADFLKENDCSVGTDEVLAALKKAAEAGKDESMSLDDMDAVAGGVDTTSLTSDTTVKTLAQIYGISEEKIRESLMYLLMA